MGSEISYCRNCGGIDTAVTSRTLDTLWHCARCCSTEIEEIDVEAVVQERDQHRAQVEDAERYKHADGDGTDRLVRAIHGRKAKGRDYIGGSQANMLHEGADLIEKLRARLAEREAWIQEAMAIFDKLAEAAAACTCWPCCNGECMSNPWTDLRDLHEAAESLRKRAR